MTDIKLQIISVHRSVHLFLESPLIFSFKVPPPHIFPTTMHFYPTPSQSPTHFPTPFDASTFCLLSCDPSSPSWQCHFFLFSYLPTLVIPTPPSYILPHPLQFSNLCLFLSLPFQSAPLYLSSPPLFYFTPCTSLAVALYLLHFVPPPPPHPLEPPNPFLFTSPFSVSIPLL